MRHLFKQERERAAELAAQYKKDVAALKADQAMIPWAREAKIAELEKRYRDAIAMLTLQARHQLPAVREYISKEHDTRRAAFWQKKREELGEDGARELYLSQFRGLPPQEVRRALDDAPDEWARRTLTVAMHSLMSAPSAPAEAAPLLAHAREQVRAAETAALGDLVEQRDDYIEARDSTDFLDPIMAAANFAGRFGLTAE